MSYSTSYGSISVILSYLIYLTISAKKYQNHSDETVQYEYSASYCLSSWFMLKSLDTTIETTTELFYNIYIGLMPSHM